MSNENEFMTTIGRIRNAPNHGYSSARLLELSGAEIIEPTAFEPDANTFRGKYYYNATTNTLYMKIVTKNEPGIVVAHWQRVSE